MLSVLRRFTASGYPFSICKHFLDYYYVRKTTKPETYKDLLKQFSRYDTYWKRRTIKKIKQATDQSNVLIINGLMQINGRCLWYLLGRNWTKCWTVLNILFISSLSIYSGRSQSPPIHIHTPKRATNEINPKLHIANVYLQTTPTHWAESALAPNTRPVKYI